MTNLVAKGASVIIAVALIWTSLIKVCDVPAFAIILLSHGVMNPLSASLVAWIVPLVELSLGAFLLISLVSDSSLGSSISLAAIAAMFFCFSVYMVILIAFPPQAPTPCGCGFSSSVVHNWIEPALRNMFFSTVAASAAWGIHFPKPPGATSRSDRSPQEAS